MSIYKEMYLSLFNSVTDALELLPERPEQATDLMKTAQQKCESMYIEDDEEE